MPLDELILTLYSSIIALIISAYASAMGLFSTGLPLLQQNAQAQHLPGRARLAAAFPAPQPPQHQAGDKFPGMVNLSGVLCYMNSVLQAFASLPTLYAHLEKIITLAEAVDIPTPVTDALGETLAQLNTGHARRPPPLRPHELLQALSPLPAIRRLLTGREQQDAHELFVVLAGALSDEAEKVAKELALRADTRGMGLALDLGITHPRQHKGLIRSPSLNDSERGRPTKGRPRTPRQPWEGLLARRRVCTRCGYADVVRVDTLGGMELSVPRTVSCG